MPNVSLEGYQIVRGTYFKHQNPPMMTIWKQSVSFNNVSIEMLNNCECIQLMCNDNNRCILICPASSNDKDAVVWKSNSAVPPRYRKMDCTNFSRPLLERWQFDLAYRYRAYGRLVQADKKVMLLFDFREAEIWDGKRIKEHV